MSDARLRELERAWRTTGAVADEAAWLAERVRTGGLAEVRLLLAAELGHAAAAQAVAAPLPREPLLKWWHAPFGFGRTLRQGGPLLFEGPAWPSRAAVLTVRQALTASGLGGAWFAAGHEALMRAALALFDRVPAEADRLGPGLSLADVHEVEASIAGDQRPARRTFEQLETFPLDPIRFLGHGPLGYVHPWFKHVTRLAERLGEKEARRAVEAELVPWALGTGDALRARVEARRR